MLPPYTLTHTLTIEVGSTHTAADVLYWQMYPWGLVQSKTREISDRHPIENDLNSTLRPKKEKNSKQINPLRLSPFFSWESKMTSPITSQLGFLFQQKWLMNQHARGKEVLLVYSYLKTEAKSRYVKQARLFLVLQKTSLDLLVGGKGLISGYLMSTILRVVACFGRGRHWTC